MAEPKRQPNPPPICCWCRKHIRGIPCFQGSDERFPSHRKCLVVIRPPRRGE